MKAITFILAMSLLFGCQTNKPEGDVVIQTNQRPNPPSQNQPPTGTPRPSITPTPTATATPSPTPSSAPVVSVSDILELTPAPQFHSTVFDASQVGASFCSNPANDRVYGLFRNPPSISNGNSYYYYYYFTCVDGKFIHSNTSANIDPFRINEIRTVNTAYSFTSEFSGRVDGYFAILKSTSAVFQTGSNPGIFLIVENKRSNGDFSLGCARCYNYLSLASTTGATAFSVPVSSVIITDSSGSQRAIPLYSVSAP